MARLDLSNPHIESRFEALVRSSHDAIIDKTLDGTILSWNPAAERLYGYAAEEAMGSNIRMLEPEERRGEIDGFLASVARGERVERVETRHRRKDGQLIDVELTISPVLDATGRPAGASMIARDIGERKRLYAALAASEGRYRLLAENTADLVTVTAPDGTLEYASPSIRDLLGYAPETVIGKPSSMFVFPQDESGRWGARAEAVERSNASATLRLLRNDGTWVWCESRLQAVDPGSPTSRFVAVSRDVTERKRAEDEVRALNATLEARVLERTADLQASRDELEAFAYLVSHDLRAPLRAIDGFSRILLDEHAADLDDEGMRVLGVVVDNVGQMGRLIDDLLTFSRLGRASFNVTSVDMDGLARTIADGLRSQEADRTIEIDVGQLAEVPADLATIRQVWMNLIGNAIKFTRNRRIARITIRSEWIDGYVEYSIRDNGAGFDQAYVDPLFGVFHRLHPTSEFEGTGIGLAVVKRIVTRHGGWMRAEGKVDDGATLTFALPLEGGPS